MKTETIRALELLYGSSEIPVCAVAADLTVLWCPDPAAETLVMLLGTELVGAETTADILPAQSDSFLLHAAQPPRICRIQTLREDGVPFYLLQFPPCPAHRGINVAEARALLSAQAAAGRQAALALMQAAHMAAAHDTKSPLKQDHLAVLPCYALLNRTLRCEELLWYDALETGQTAPQFGCTALEGCLTDFLNELSNACGGAIRVTEQHIAEGLCAAVEPKRLHIALLLLVLNMQEQLAGYSELALFAAQTDNGACAITLRMCAAAEEAPVPAEFRQRICVDGTLLSDTSLLDCFCRTFGAAYETAQEDGAFRSTLTLPPVPADHPLALRSPIRRLAGSRSTLTHVLLSDVLYVPR